MSESVDPTLVTARSWLAKAGDDLTIADLVVDSDVGVEWAACFTEAHRLVELAQTAVRCASERIVADRHE